jgi:hypothetical protein
LNIDERTLDFSGEGIGSNPNIPPSSSVSATTSSSFSAPASATGVASGSGAAFLDEEIPSMLARKSQCPAFLPPASAATGSPASSFDFTTASGAGSAVS